MPRATHVLMWKQSNDPGCHGRTATSNPLPQRATCIPGTYRSLAPDVKHQARRRLDGTRNCKALVQVTAGPVRTKPSNDQRRPNPIQAHSSRDGGGRRFRPQTRHGSPLGCVRPYRASFQSPSPRPSPNGRGRIVLGVGAQFDQRQHGRNEKCPVLK